jgi:uncharacterized membrane protein YdjX (TVP38/TMEM64 family)
LLLLEPVMRGDSSSDAANPATAIPTRRRTPRSGLTRGPWLRLLVALVLIAALVLVWRTTGVRELDSVAEVESAVEALRASPLAALYVLGGFVLGTLLFMPVTLLMTGTILALGPVQGMPCAFAGALIAASLGHLAGRLLGHGALHALEAPRFQKLRHDLATRGVRTTIAARFMPVGNFTLLNMLAGSMGVPFKSFLLGNALGLLPWILGIGLFAGQVARLLD